MIVLFDTNLLIDLIKRLAMSFVTWAQLLKATALRRAGTPIGANDLWIACHALALEATLVTHNLREFTRIRGLSLVDWVQES